MKEFIIRGLVGLIGAAIGAGACLYWTGSYAVYSAPFGLMRTERVTLADIDFLNDRIEEVLYKEMQEFRCHAYLFPVHDGTSIRVLYVGPRRLLEGASGVEARVEHALDGAFKEIERKAHASELSEGRTQ